MPYDLLLRRQLSGSVARDDTSEGRLDPHDVSLERGLLMPVALGLATAAVVAASLCGLPGKARRAAERTYYKATRRDLGSTQETPAVTMRELVYGPGDES
jgi:hypothetical protein